MSAITWFPVVGCKFSMSHFQFWQILLTFNCRDTVMSHQTLILVMSLTFHLIDLGERGVQLRGGDPILANTSYFRLHRLRTFSVLSHRTLASALSAKFCFSKSGLCQNMRDGFNMKFIDMWG